MITFDDFKKLDIRIGKVLSCERVPEADKLLKFIFDIGGEERQIMAGLAQFVEEPSALVGKEMPVLCNLEPRTFRGYESQGMILAVDADGTPILLHPERDTPPGSVIR